MRGGLQRFGIVPFRRSAAAAVFAAGAALPAAPVPAAAQTPIVYPQVLREVERVPGFTQGLVFLRGLLYESTGLYGESALRIVDPHDGRVRRSVRVPDEYFAEGLALDLQGRLVQLTWHAGRTFSYDPRTLRTVVAPRRYTGEGWGLCRDGREFLMSDGSSEITVRSPDTFDVIQRIRVTEDGRPVQLLNELECVDGRVYANVWQTADIVTFNAFDGRVDARISLAPLLYTEHAQRADWGVANGIAYDPGRGTFWVTGKNWDRLYEVRFGTAP